MSDPTTEERLAEAMASFGRGIVPPEDGWRDVVAGRPAIPGGPGRQRLVVALAAAVLVAVLVAAGASLATRGGGRSVHATEPSAPPSTAPPSTATVPTDPNADIAACLVELGAPYRIIQGDGGPGFGPPEGATDEERRAFSEGIAVCQERLFPTPSPEEQARDRAYGQQYVDDIVACLGEAGIVAEAVPSGGATGAGAWQIETPGVSQASADFRRANDRCTEEAAANERAARAANGD